MKYDNVLYNKSKFTLIEAQSTLDIATGNFLQSLRLYGTICLANTPKKDDNNTDSLPIGCPLLFQVICFNPSFLLTQSNLLLPLLLLLLETEHPSSFIEVPSFVMGSSKSSAIICSTNASLKFSGATSFASNSGAP